MAQQNGRRIFKTIMKSHRVRIPKYEHLPIRLRPWFLLFTTLVMFVLAFLGFTNFSRSLPLNDKALHFLCFGLATGVRSGHQFSGRHLMVTGILLHIRCGRGSETRLVLAKLCPDYNWLCVLLLRGNT
jgi:hypothetical protein